MNKKIKAIYVLDKLANDENFRPPVKFRDMTYKYDKSIEDYTNDFNSEYGIFSGWAINLILNDEVEILEDNTEEIEEIGEFVDLIGMNGNEEELFKMIRCCTHKIDELVQAVNKMKGGKE